MTWQPPADWQEGIVDAMSAAMHERGLTSADVTRRGGPGHRHFWNWGQLNVRTGKYALPTLRSLVAWCAAVGVRPSDLLRKGGL